MMKIDLRKRGTGKTTDLIKRSIEEGFNMVVMNEIEKKRLALEKYEYLKRPSVGINFNAGMKNSLATGGMLCRFPREVK